MGHINGSKKIFDPKLLIIILIYSAAGHPKIGCFVSNSLHFFQYWNDFPQICHNTHWQNELPCANSRSKSIRFLGCEKTGWLKLDELSQKFDAVLRDNTELKLKVSKLEFEIGQQKTAYEVQEQKILGLENENKTLRENQQKLIRENEQLKYKLEFLGCEKTGWLKPKRIGMVLKSRNPCYARIPGWSFPRSRRVVMNPSARTESLQKYKNYEIQYNDSGI